MLLGRVVFACLLVVLLAACEKGPTDDIKGSISEAASQGKGTLLVFTAKDCDACKRMLPHLEHFKIEHSNMVRVINVDFHERPLTSSRYEVDMVPVEFFYDREGQNIKRHDGYYSIDDMEMVFINHGVDLSAREVK